MLVNEAGRLIQSLWAQLPQHYPIGLDAFVLMPNHLHGIVVIEQPTQNVRISPTDQISLRKPDQKPLSLADIVHRFKSLSTRRYADEVKKQQWQPFPGRLWQRNYWEHVIRNEIELDYLRQYIDDNPKKVG